jgi:hypothetical protein
MAVLAPADLFGERDPHQPHRNWDALTLAKMVGKSTRVDFVG